ncbi:Uncharacterized membrane protein [Kandleria vitulina]|uniref:Uncharacterized membrane protein n=1 Tax=Kandleria vitulina TaxID=1630 RepID=A0A1H2QKE0_9FIRM|nr:QueT transporter family protein [Kandleria vitulina]SDW07328.1 Uncharacterized membrane protein [Kandleria vitulina]HBG67253.1 QueT transporter family protein [Kandleria vitulina]
MDSKVKTIAFNAIIAAIYAVMTLAISPIAYGAVQLRVSEIIIFLAFYNKKYIPGLVLGCIIANLFSPLGLWDVCFGTVATILTLLAMNALSNRYLAAIAGGVFNGIIVGVELTILFKELPLFLNIFYVFAGEFAILLIGAFIFGMIEKNKVLMEHLEL